MNFGKSDNSSSSNNAFNQNFNGTDNYSGTTNYNQAGNTTQAGNTNGTSTTTAINPDWVSTLARNIAQGGAGLAGANPQSYVAGPTGLQLEAGNNIAGVNSSPWNFNGAADLTRGVAANQAWAQPLMSDNPLTVSGGKASQWLQNYMDPALQSEEQATLANFDNNAAQTKAQQQLDLAKAGAFGGSGAGVAQGVTDGQLALARGQLDAGLRQGAFSQALQGAENDANNATSAREANAANNLTEQQLQADLGLNLGNQQLAAGNQLAGLSTQYDQNQIANAEAQSGIGSNLQGIYQAQASAPLALQQYLASLFSGLPLNLFNGSTTAANQNQVGVQNTNQNGAQTQNGTETQTGTTSGTSSGTGNSSGFGFGVNLFGNGRG